MKALIFVLFTATLSAQVVVGGAGSGSIVLGGSGGGSGPTIDITTIGF